MEDQCMCVCVSKNDLDRRSIKTFYTDEAARSLRLLSLCFASPGVD